MFPIRDLNPTRIVPAVTLLIIALNIAAFFFWQQFPQSSDTETAEFLYERAAIACELTTGDQLTERELDLDVCDSSDSGTELFPGKNIWFAGLASMFLHGSLLHILANMWFLWIFGNNVEEAFGTSGYLAVYLASGLVATAAFVALNPNATVPLVGASGAIAGILGAYLVLYPTHRVLSWFLFFFVPIPAVLFLGFWFLSQFGIGDPGVAWEAHVGGFVFGAVLTTPFRAVLLRRVDDLHRTARYQR
ncbi:MAG: rhomboid family intramembrane serine protease [Acidimicrobiia bacterium]